LAPEQFADLAELCKRFKGQPFTLVCAPSAQFLGQELPNGEQIHSLVLGKLAESGGSFIVLERLNVNGSTTHPLFHFLKRFSSLYRPKRGRSVPIPWNFSKFLVNKAGRVVEFRGPTVSALDLEAQVKNAIDESYF